MQENHLLQLLSVILQWIDPPDAVAKAIRYYHVRVMIPFASDLKGLFHVSVKFQKGHPFEPFYQLMRVLPRSAGPLPKPYAKLITDEGSKISDFDPVGNMQVAFIDEERLMAETRRVEEELTVGPYSLQDLV
ncbi:5'-3' exoribonuclease [Corchorus olitorius]|uniref:5'-3' exoribonuclease n=1 Tax=Corchorus olitorius TaxID=93759 RepID=A0A1R3G4Q8_9ROSI|nr:5'-3' exoribonuclease [Corchorus olitorius]